MGVGGTWTQNFQQHRHTSAILSFLSCQFEKKKELKKSSLLSYVKLSDFVRIYMGISP